MMILFQYSLPLDFEEKKSEVEEEIKRLMFLILLLWKLLIFLVS